MKIIISNADGSALGVALFYRGKKEAVCVLASGMVYY